MHALEAGRSAELHCHTVIFHLAEGDDGDVGISCAPLPFDHPRGRHSAGPGIPKTPRKSSVRLVSRGWRLSLRWSSLCLAANIPTPLTGRLGHLIDTSTV